MGYGIPDVSAANLGAASGRKSFYTLVERAISTYEPRFLRVKVLPLENADTTDRTLRFRIEALLNADPVPEPVVYDSALERSTGNFEVRDASGAALVQLREHESVFAPRERLRIDGEVERFLDEQQEDGDDLLRAYPESLGFRCIRSGDPVLVLGRAATEHE